MMTLHISKVLLKIFSSIALFAAIITYSAGTFAADSGDDARKFIEHVSHDALAVITSNENDKSKESKLAKLFVNSVDTKWMAKFAMGKQWREATERQRNEYAEAHKKFLLSNYVPKFRQYNNQEIKILKAFNDEKNAGEYIVETQIVPKEGAAINIDYKIRKSDGGKFMIYDVVAEGVSLIATQRSDFASVLGRGGIDELIKKLGEKT